LSPYIFAFVFVFNFRLNVSVFAVMKSLWFT